MEILGYFGTLLIIIAYLPQTIKTLKTRNTKGLSKYMYLLIIVSSITWIIYSISINNYPILICNILNLIQSLIILHVIIINENRIKIQDRIKIKRIKNLLQKDHPNIKLKTCYTGTIKILEVGKSLYLKRDDSFAFFITSPIVKITHNKIFTQNSIYKFKKIK